MTIKDNNGKLIMYNNSKGIVELRADTDKETIWATQAQIADLFNVERSVVTKHIKNILMDNEVKPKSNVQKMHIAKYRDTSLRKTKLPHKIAIK